ncbi:MAG: gamma-glutamyltransferase [Eubacterium sp.]|nr:gamma-glutamyltransferase [Eubacterium sp.]
MNQKALSKRIISGLLACFIAFSFSSCKNKDNNGSEIYRPKDIVMPETSEDSKSLGGFAVSSSSEEATSVGMQILSSGGNAVDAAAAMSLTLSVTEPYSSGIGGSGVMLIYDTRTKLGYTLDYYCSAGKSSSSDDYIGVPGLLAGTQDALDRFGTITMAEALQPAIDYAEKGFTATNTFISRLRSSDSLRENPAYSDLKKGDKIIQSELGETLKTIQKEGISVFYEGSIAQKIADNCELTTDDLASYQTYCEDIIRSSFNEYSIIGAYAPFSSVTVMQMLKVAENLHIPSVKADPNAYLSVLKTATMSSFDSRNRTLVDPRFYKFDSDDLLSDDYIESLAKKNVSNYKDDPEQLCTTQFSVIDNNGLIVCVTNSLSDSWGSYKCVGGFYLNNSLINFGNTSKNVYEPGKRPRTHFAPIIVEGNNGEVLAIGSPGGVYIPKIVTGVLIDILSEKEDVLTAVNKTRVMYNSEGNLCVETDDKFSSIIDVKKVKEQFYYNTSHIFFGCTSIVGYKPEDGFISVSDHRRETSKALVYYYD